MSRMTVNDVYKTLEVLRGVYQFDDEKTIFRLDYDVLTNSDTIIRIATVDEETGITVDLSKSVLSDR